jgi:tetratricopeptide (TPR) repeat protein
MVRSTRQNSKTQSTVIRFRGAVFAPLIALSALLLAGFALVNLALSTGLEPALAQAQNLSTQPIDNGNNNNNVAPATPPPSVDLTLLKAGRAYFDKHDLTAALQSFYQFRDQRPNNLAVHFWLATTLAALGRDKEATPEYVNCLNLSASIGLDSTELRDNLANALCRGGFTKEPTFDYQRALAIDPRCPAPYLGLAKCLIDAGNFDEALVALDKYLKNGGADLNGLLLQGLAHAGKDQFDLARNDLTSFLQMATANGAANRKLDNDLNSAPTSYVVLSGTTGSVSPGAIELANKILSQLPAAAKTQ